MFSSRAAGAATQGTVEAPTVEVMLCSRAAGWLAGKGTTRFLLRLAELLSACSGCDAWLSKSVGRKPASIRRLRAGKPESRVNTGLAGRCSGNARKHWASGKAGLLRCGFCYGFPLIRYRHRYSPKIKEAIQINNPINAI